MTRHVWRLPMLLLVPVLVAAAIVVQRDDTTSSTPVRADRLGPVAPGAEADGSTWYCAAGSATGVATGDGAGAAEHVVVVANLSDAPITGLLTVVPSEGEPAVQPLEVPAHGRVEVPPSSVVVAPWASAIVELDGGQVAVEHTVEGPGGASVAPCASHPSPTWYFPAGTTRAGTTMLVNLFNPFPGEASVDLTFETEDGTRTPQQFQGLVVPGGRVTVVDVGAVVTLRDEIATTVRARNGRIIAEQILISDGTDGSAEGLTTALGAPLPAENWVFAELSAPAPGRTATMSVLNPGEQEADVEVQIYLDDPTVNGTVEPFTLTVGPTRYGAVDLYEDGRIPAGIDGWVLVRSTNGVPVVAERLDGGNADAEESGLAAVTGSPVQAQEWILPHASGPAGDVAQLVIVNPSPSADATVSLRADTGGVSQELPGAASVVVPAGSRVVVSLSSEALGLEAISVLVSADAPVVVGRTVVFESGDIADSPGIAVVGTESLLVDLARPEAFIPDATDTEDVPFDAPLVDPGASPAESVDPATTVGEG